jgi:hypothetical protein
LIGFRLMLILSCTYISCQRKTNDVKAEKTAGPIDRTKIQISFQGFFKIISTQSFSQNSHSNTEQNMITTSLRQAVNISKVPLKKVAEQLLPSLALYRRLLRVHRKALPIEMRVMGDEYVKVRLCCFLYCLLYHLQRRTSLFWIKI